MPHPLSDRSLPRFDVPRPGLTAAAVLVISAVMNSACQPLSRPFQPESKTVALEGYLEPGPRAGLVVTSPSGVPEQSSRRLAVLLAASLRDRGIAASTDTPKNARYQLHGNIEVEDDPFAASEDGLTIALHWKLFDLQGDVAGIATQKETIGPAAWRNLVEATMVAIVGRAAPRIERLLDGYGDSPIPPQPLEAVVVYRVDGAPGDGAETLLHGMRRALRMKRVPVVDGITEDTYVVLGAVHIESGPTPQQQIVQIDWTVIRPDGRRVGSVRQQNAVETGRLDSAWGTIATAAAYGGADGVVSLLEAIGIYWQSPPIGR